MKSIHSQQGMILVTSLIFLLMLTVIAMVSMQDATIQEKMASNTHDNNLAFQAAESGLRQAEADAELNLAAASSGAASTGMANYQWEYSQTEIQQQSMQDLEAGVVSTPSYVYRVESLGTGPGGAQVVLQSTYME